MAAVALAAVALLVGADRAAYAWSLDRMLDTIEATEDVMESERGVVEEIMAPYGNQSLSQQQIADVRTQTRHAFSELEADLIVAADPMAGQVLAPWWRTLHDVRGDYRDHIDAWVERFAAVSDDPATLGDPSAAIRSTFRLACDAMRGAVPTVDVFGAADRVEAVCAD